MPALYVTHGGGPLPLLGDPAHAELVDFLRSVPDRFARPEAIVIVSAHWETRFPTITSGATPSLIYDYGGFPPESYEIQYPAPGAPELAQRVQQLLNGHQIDAVLDDRRGFDHGMFVPLKLMYPDADIPCVQLSLLESFDPAEHIAMGQALSPLMKENVLLLGSGSSFHNMRVMLGMMRGVDSGREQSIEFNDWLINTCSGAEIDPERRAQLLIDWESAPQARFSHPREEHLLPVHVCLGAGEGQAAEVVFNGELLNLAISAFLWS